jgi:hypothetical protein
MTTSELRHTPVGTLLVWASKAGHVPVEYRGRHDIGGEAGAVIITRSPHETPVQTAVYLRELMTYDQSIAATLRAERDRLRESLTWAVGFIRCNLPKTAAEYPDMRNAADLVAARPVHAGEFQRADCRAELAEHDRDRFRAALELIAQVRHVSGSAQAAFRSTLRTVDAVLAGADVRDVETVEAIAAGTWKPGAAT